MLDAIVWFVGNIFGAFANFATAIFNPSLWLDWSDKQAIMRFVYYGGSVEFFFVVFTAFLILTAGVLWNRRFGWGVVWAMEGFANTVGRFFAWAGLIMVLQQIIIVFVQRIFARPLPFQRAIPVRTSLWISLWRRRTLNDARSVESGGKPKPLPRNPHLRRRRSLTNRPQIQRRLRRPRNLATSPPPFATRSWSERVSSVSTRTLAVGVAVGLDSRSTTSIRMLSVGPATRRTFEPSAALTTCGKPSSTSDVHSSGARSQRLLKLLARSSGPGPRSPSPCRPSIASDTAKPDSNRNGSPGS